MNWILDRYFLPFHRLFSRQEPDPRIINKGPVSTAKPLSAKPLKPSALRRWLRTGRKYPNTQSSLQTHLTHFDPVREGSSVDREPATYLPSKLAVANSASTKGYDNSPYNKLGDFRMKANFSKWLIKLKHKTNSGSTRVQVQFPTRPTWLLQDGEAGLPWEATFPRAGLTRLTYATIYGAQTTQ